MKCRNLPKGALLLAVMVLAAACRGGGQPSIATPATPTPIPWVGEPAPAPVIPTPYPTPTPDLAGPPCSAADVDIESQGGNGGGGHTWHYLSVRNRGTDDCILDGYPTVSAVVGAGSVEATTDTLIPPMGTGGRLHPGENGRLVLETSANCPARQAGPPVSSDALVFQFGGGEQTLALSTDVTCGLGVQRFTIEMPPPVHPPSLSAPLEHLEVTVILPPSVERGATLRYVVELANPTDSDIALDPCPGYIEDTDNAKETHRLNCGAVGSIPAHAAIRFAMELVIPESATEGAALVYWDLLGLPSHRIGHPVQILAPGSGG